MDRLRPVWFLLPLWHDLLVLLFAMWTLAILLEMAGEERGSKGGPFRRLLGVARSVLR